MKAVHVLMENRFSSLPFHQAPPTFQMGFSEEILNQLLQSGVQQKIKFTLETDLSNRIDFLDLTISRNGNTK